jgi:acetyltransferase-like isoleucine patch superfamily enzyme
MEQKLNSNLKLLVIGSSRHASVLVDAIELAGKYRVAGYLDDTLTPGTIRRGYSVLGGLGDVAQICAEQLIDSVAIAVGDNWWRRKVHSDLVRKCPGLEFPVVKHPSSVIAASAEISRGAAILACSHIGPGSRVGEFCIINTGSSMDHDCTMHDFASISDRISIGSHAVIGTGAVVVRDIPDLVVAYGSPARVQRSRLEGETYIRDLT